LLSAQVSRLHLSRSHRSRHHKQPIFEAQHADDAMSTPTPLAGRLVPLRTKDEVRASLETHPAYVVEVPAKFANAVKE
jgi:hypothetical protein